MAHFSSPLPWLDKPLAMRRVVELILASAGAAGGFVGYLDYADGEPHWRQPKGERKLIELQDERLWSSEFDGPSDWLERSIAHLAEHPRAVSAGTFIFVLSDFIPTPSKEMWLTAVEHRWDLVPVVIQDPTWEQSFPDVSGIVVPLRDPRTGRIVPVRLTGEAKQRPGGRRTRSARGICSRHFELSTSTRSSSRRATRPRFSRRSSPGPTCDERGGSWEREHVSRGRLRMSAAFAVVAGLLVVVVLLARGRESGGESTARNAPAIEARTDLTPRSVFFGDMVTALVEVTLDRNRVDPDSVRVQTDFTPWKPIANPERLRRDTGATTSLRVSYTLRCLTSACIATDETATFLEKAIQTFGRGASDLRGPGRSRKQRSCLTRGALAPAPRRRTVLAEGGSECRRVLGRVAGRPRLPARRHVQRGSRLSSWPSSLRQAPCSLPRRPFSPTSSDRLACRRPRRRRMCLRSRF